MIYICNKIELFINVSLLRARRPQDNKISKTLETILQKIKSVQWATNLRSTSRTQNVLIHKLAPTHRGQGDTIERGRPLQGNLLRRLIYGGHRRADLHTHPPEPLKFIERSYLGSVIQSVHMVSTVAHDSLKSASLKMAPPVGTVGTVCTPRTGEARGVSHDPSPAYRLTGSHHLQQKDKKRKCMGLKWRTEMMI